MLLYRYMVRFGNRDYEIEAHSRAEALTIAEERLRKDDKLTVEQRNDCLRGHVGMYTMCVVEDPQVSYNVKVVFRGTHDEGTIYGKDIDDVIGKARSYVKIWATCNAIKPKAEKLLLYENGKLVHEEKF